MLVFTELKNSEYFSRYSTSKFGVVKCCKKNKQKEPEKTIK